MSLLPLVEWWIRWARCLRQRSVGTDRDKLPKPSAMLASAGVLCVILWGVDAPAKANDLQDGDASIATLRAYVQLISTTEGDTAAAAKSSPAVAVTAQGESDDDGYGALRAFAQRFSSPTDRRQRFADADNLYDALRNFLQKQDTPAPVEKPTAPKAPLARRHLPATDATFVGSKACLSCHASQTEVFSHTLMGRLHTQGKMECETCHGPASAHVRAAGCAACHGEGGVSTRPGMPSLVGLEPQYLVLSMKAYITGQRKHGLMRALLSGLGEAELNRIALYYANLTAAPAQTAPVGNPSAGHAAVGLCAGCHGEHGIGISAIVPNLAGQDARYLADAIRAYRQGSREKAVACTPCHGDRGISKTPGMPSLAGLDAQYLMTAMKEYVTGQRKNAVMRALLSGVGDAELNNIAQYYARQFPAPAQTPARGDLSVGKTAAAVCAGCHGEQGVSTNSAWPSLAGQDAQYLAAATKAYRDGSRRDAVMQGLVASLDDRTINDIAAYYASLPSSRANTTAGTQPSGRHDPVLVRNGLVASLDDGTINDIASYYASLSPAQSAGARGAPVGYIPVVVGQAPPSDGSSVGGIVSFRQDDPSRTADENNGICLNCHERGARVHWKGSVHETRGLACTSCHTLMKNVSAKNQLKTAFQPDTCFQCHKDRRAQMFRASHMPMREGKIVCSDCHNPHGSVTAGLIKEDSINDNCYKCHAEKRGPFLFEHAPVRENCLNCHDPHGSINEASLKMSRPRLCYECHTIGHAGATKAGPGSQFTMGRSCQNCHTLIHGSNSPAGAVFQR